MNGRFTSCLSIMKRPFLLLFGGTPKRIAHIKWQVPPLFLVKLMVFLFACWCLGALAFGQQIKMTEFYFWQSWQRLELTNVDTQDFSWEIVLQWQSLSKSFVWTGTFPKDMSIVVWFSWYAGFGLVDWVFLGDEWFWLSWLNGLSVYLSANWLIVDSVNQSTLLFSWIELDRFSLERSSTNSWEQLFFCTGWRALNMLGDVCASPWHVFPFIESWSQYSSGGEWSTGNLLSPLTTGFVQLVITEVYVDGTDEWVEISNLGNTWFAWQLQLSWAKSTMSTIVVSIRSGESVVVGDTMSRIVDRSVIGLSGLGFSLGDTNPISLSLLQSWQVVDIFGISWSRVVQFDNTQSSFERIKQDEQLVYTAVNLERARNVQVWTKANPWKFRMFQTLTVWESTGQNFTWGSENITGWTCWSMDVTFEEVHPQDDYMSVYIELQLHSNGQHFLTLSWSALWTLGPKSLFLNGQSGQRFIVSSESSVDGEEVDRIFTWMSLDNTWLLELYRAWELVDKVLLLAQQSGFSFYRSGSIGCLSTLDHLNYPTPRFSLSYLSRLGYTGEWISIVFDEMWTGLEELYLKVNNYDDLVYELWKGCMQYTWWKIKTFSNSSVNMCKTPTNKSVAVVYTAVMVKITNLIADPIWSDIGNESVRLLYLSWDYELLPLSKFYLLVSWKRKYLSGFLQSWQDLTITGTFGFPNGWTCVELYVDWSLLDTFCYSGQTKAQTTWTKTISTRESISLSALKRVFSWDRVCIVDIVHKQEKCRGVLGISSLKNQNAKLSQRVELWQERYKKLQKKTALQQKKDKLTERFLKSYISASEAYLKKNWSVVYLHSKLPTFKRVYQSGLNVIKNGSTNFWVNWNSIPITNIPKILPRFEFSNYEKFEISIEPFFSQNWLIWFQKRKDLVDRGFDFVM